MHWRAVIRRICHSRRPRSWHWRCWPKPWTPLLWLVKRWKLAHWASTARTSWNGRPIKRLKSMRCLLRRHSPTTAPNKPFLWYVYIVVSDEELKVVEMWQVQRNHFSIHFHVRRTDWDTYAIASANPLILYSQWVQTGWYAGTPDGRKRLCDSVPQISWEILAWSVANRMYTTQWQYIDTYRSPQSSRSLAFCASWTCLKVPWLWRPPARRGTPMPLSKREIWSNCWAEAFRCNKQFA